MDNSKIGFFFGAGAEIDYGLPSGAEFAVSVLNPDKSLLQEAKSDFEKLCGEKNGFEKMSASDLKKICESMVENHKEDIKKLFLDSDKDFAKNHTGEKPEPIFGDFVKNNLLEENDILEFKLLSKSIEIIGANSEGNGAKEKEAKTFIDILKTLAAFNISLIFFLYGNQILENINGNFFTEKCRNILSGDKSIFLLNKNTAPAFSNDLFEILKKSNYTPPKGLETEAVFFEELKTFTNSVVNKCIDYQKLFSNFDALFYPEKNKTQFRKILSTLLIMRQLIIQKQESKKDKKSYYDEILSDSKIEIGSICTTNYSKICDDLLKNKCDSVFHLNGDVDSFFDLDEMKLLQNHKIELEETQKLVPFIYPQVALKPVMYFDVIKLYAAAYESLKSCSKIAILGFGINKDDNLLNGMFRELLKEHFKPRIYYFKYKDEIGDDESKKKEIVEKLKIEKYKDRLEVVSIDKEHKTNGKNWLEFLGTAAA